MLRNKGYVLVAMISFYLTELSGQATPDAAATAIADACDKELYITKLKEHFSTISAPYESAITHLTKDMRRFALAAAAAPDSKTRCVLHGLKAAVAAALQTNEQLRRQTQAKAKAAAELLSKHLTRVARAKQLHNTQTKVKTGSLHTRKPSGAEAVKILLETDSKLAGGCATLEPATTTKIKNSDIQIRKLVTMKIVDETKLDKLAGETAFTVTADRSCNGASNTQADANTVFHSCAFGSSGKNNAGNLQLQPEGSKHIQECKRPGVPQRCSASTPVRRRRRIYGQSALRGSEVRAAGTRAHLQRPRSQSKRCTASSSRSM
ncbi:uncharacterized protein TEOVI_000227800 [Trypanosoma equiperdum]|uniref:Trypanosome variant surface glycoprotein (A-type) n=1 Tax=Trypanosoma equiperdum TaxID=5694 RepID=A0A1G4IE61_TRYEQ|nr:hypothetical protein, conserved [Trypanosoma equiperdum]